MSNSADFHSSWPILPYTSAIHQDFGKPAKNTSQK